jgi:hypothetical protein
MAFLNSLGGKLKNAGQSIAQSTRNFADVTKLKKSISDYEKQIAGLYTIIGKAYYEKHKDEADAESKENIVKITSLFEEINELKLQIKEIEGLVKCPNCGCDVPADAAFCNHCGGKIQKEPEGISKCPNCGKEVPEDALFCNSCGCKITKEAEVKSCSNCGQPLAEDSAFCVHCGTKVEQAETEKENV